MDELPKWNSEKIKKFYSVNRIHWDQLYSSQKKILKKSDIGKESNILDLGCACGGLYKILKEKFQVKNYTGIDINKECIEYAKRLYKNAEFIADNVFLMEDGELNGKFDFVISFGFIDCSGVFYKAFNKILKYLKPDGKLILDLRLTNEKDLLDINESFQYLDYSGEKNGEKVPYDVINLKNFKEYLNKKFKNYNCYSVGYNLAPSKNAVLKYKKICFSTWLIQPDGDNKKEFDLPLI
jgi:SAM-dependent methyltransferase